MAVATSTLIVAGLALAVAGTAGQFVASRVAASAQKKSAAEEKRAARLQASRQRRQEIRRARITRGQTLNVAGQVGAAGGSGLSGGLASLGAQVGSNLGFSTQTEGIGRNIARFGRQATSADSFRAIAGGVAQLGGALFSNAGALGRPSAAPEFAPLPVPRPF